MDRRKSLLNQSERKTLLVLSKTASEHSAEVFTKVRIADALELAGSKLSNDLFTYALKAHFDFVVGRGAEAKTLFAVEFDGPVHTSDASTINNDKKKEKLCLDLGLPLLRIDGGALRKIGQRPILGWLVHMWFMNELWDQTEHLLFEEFDSILWYKFDPNLEKAVNDLLRTGETFIDGQKITRETPLNHPALKKLTRLTHDSDMDPFQDARNYLFLQSSELGFNYSTQRHEDSAGYWRGTTKIEFKNGHSIIGKGGCKPNVWPAIWHLPEDLAMHDAALQLQYFKNSRML